MRNTFETILSTGLIITGMLFIITGDFIIGILCLIYSEVKFRTYHK